MLINDVFTPYKDVIFPILSELVENKLEQEIELPNGKVLLPNEMISWLELIRLKLGNNQKVIRLVIRALLEVIRLKLEMNQK